MAGRRRFTLIEILVVIAIITILTAIAIPAVSSVRTRSQVKAMTAYMERVKLALENYSNDFGDYPPSRMKTLKLKKSNGRNDGIECLVRCLTTTRKGGPYFEIGDQHLGNLDGDRLISSKNPTSSSYTKKDLFEIVDTWGSPLVYIHNMDYAKGMTVTLAKGDTASVGAAKSEKTGQYKGLTTFQLWSAGPDGKANTDDDIRVWGE